MLDLARLKHLIQFKGLTDSAWIWKHLCVCKDLVQHIQEKSCPSHHAWTAPSPGSHAISVELKQWCARPGIALGLPSSKKLTRSQVPSIIIEQWNEIIVSSNLKIGGKTRMPQLKLILIGTA